MKRAISAMLVLLCIASTFSGCSRLSESVKNSAAMSPVEVVALNFMAQRTGDMDLWLSTMTEKYKETELIPKLGTGVISLKIEDIHEITGEQREQRLDIIFNGKSTTAADLGLTRDDVVFVYVRYDGQYDGTKVFFNSGVIEHSYTLYRVNDNDPWLISNSGYGNGGL